MPILGTMEEQVHYEVLARRPGMAVHLEAWLEDQHRALQLADEMIGSGEFAGVMVVRETRNAKTGEFYPLCIRKEGDLTSPVTRKLRSGDLPPPRCASAKDLYGPMSRSKIAEVLDGWLARHRVTAFELIHRLDLMDKLRNGGHVFQHAIQKFAVPEALLRRSTVHEVIRSLHTVIDEGMVRLRATTQAGAFPKVDSATFAQVCESLLDHEERIFLVAGGVSAWLGEAETWLNKIERIIELAEAAPASGESRELALFVLAQPLGEILSTHAAMSELLGPGADGEELEGGERLAALTQLVSPDVLLAIAERDPKAAALIPKPSPVVRRLATLLAEAKLAALPTALGRRILAEIGSSKRLRPNSAEEEVEIVRALATTLIAAADKLGGDEAVREAFVTRSTMMVGTEFVTDFLKNYRTAFEEALALVRLTESVVGGTHKRQAIRWIQSAVTSLKFDNELFNSSQPSPIKLGALANLSNRIIRAAGKTAGVEPLLQILGDMGARIESEARLIANLSKSAAPAVQKLQALVRMAAGETAPVGPVTERAKREAKRLMALPETTSDLSRDPGTLRQLHEIMQALDKAA